MSPVTVLSALMLMLAQSSLCQESFIPERCLYIDHNSTTNNFLFRSNEPLYPNRTFAYDELVSTMRTNALKQANVVLPEVFIIVDLCLLTDLDPNEKKDMEVEEAFFNDYPEKGLFVNWPLYGTITSPNLFPSDIRDKLAKDLPNWMGDQLPSKVPTIHEWLSVPTEIPAVYLIHCEFGDDRTGELSGSYYMEYLNMSYQEVLAVNYQIGNRTIDTTVGWGLDWFCYYLAEALNYPLDCDSKS